MKKKVFLIIIGILIFAFGTWHFGLDMIDYYQGRQTYSMLGNYAQVPAVLTAPLVQTMETAPVEETVPEKSEPDIVFPDVDFASLEAINPEIIAWIYSEDTAISYPVAHNTNSNFYYLDHMFTREGNGSGCIYLDRSNAADFSDDNSIIYGHNMKNGTMFASLLEYKNPGYFEAHPRILLVTREHRYCLELFAGIVTHASSADWKMNYADRDGFAAWLDSVKERSVFDSPVVPMAEDRVVSLSTCTYEYDDARFLILGVLKEYESAF